ncbi:hypothetical protein ACQRIU_003676 [Beauveria bassiana]
MAAPTYWRPASPQDGSEPSYIDYETFLSPDFSATSFANSLVLATNNPQDTPLDLSTPLSRVLFDAQEIDSHIDLLTTRSAVPLLEHTGSQTASTTSNSRRRLSISMLKPKSCQMFSAGQDVGGPNSRAWKLWLR